MLRISELFILRGLKSLKMLEEKLNSNQPNDEPQLITNFDKITITPKNKTENKPRSQA